MVILADTYAPGWSATVDGQPTPIYEAYTLVRGVVAPAGAHTIDLVYRPRSVLLGAALLTLASLAAVLFSIGPRFSRSPAGD
jgi:uncharacterized membrane protein YfhO